MSMRSLYCVIVVALSMSQMSFGLYSVQKLKQIDSIIENSRLRVYENPDESIDLGLSTFNNPEYSIKTKVNALMLVSLAYTSKRNYQKALEYVVKAEEYSMQLDNKVLQIEVLFRTGILYQQLKIFDKSIIYLEKTEKMVLDYPVRDSVRKYLANSYTVKGFIYKDNLNCDIALDFFDKGIAEYQKVKNEEVNTNLSIAYYNKGNCYTILTQYDNAKESFNRAIELAKQVKANSLVAFAKKGLAEVFTEQGDYLNAINYLQAALEQSKNVGDLVLNSGIYKGLMDNYLALNQWENYQKYYELYSKSQLELKISERNSVSDSLNENIIRKNKSLNQLQKQTFNRLKIFFLLVAIIIISVFIIEKRNRKMIKILQNEIKKIQNQNSIS